MYHGHDMSSHEVVVRSLLEVLQEFGEADQGGRTVRVTAVSGSFYRSSQGEHTSVFKFKFDYERLA